ncbi:MAG: anaerobic carbon-monoxide dehydrogenase catalytic subunit [Chloroflexi bacterium]|nr:anaerobic carbon-monoxide dehydrogenase catalytic subunit [Chloroflexota bacterium]MCL5074904.1 anaerobic carbon-monoxide dehydrogenase catalytic subunit [Chloroflexota bacterium]
MTIRTIDPAAAQLLEMAQAEGLSTAFQRAEEMKPCPIGADGRCCKNCEMGPCRLVKEGQVGICGATLETVSARNLARAIAAGAASHSDHGRDLAFALLAVAEGTAPGYQIKDEVKLHNVAQFLGLKVEGKSREEVARALAEKSIAIFGQQRGALPYLARAPQRRQELWQRVGLIPRGVDREVVDMLHRTHMGNDQDAEHLLRQALRTALADGWGGSMLGTDLSDILFGTPGPLTAKVNLGVLKEDEVNVVIHGHEPSLSEMIVLAARAPELVEYAKSKGAKGINLAGICCTSNEVLMRQGVPSAGNFLNQELAIITGAVDAMVVDVQCIMQALPDLATRFHTAVITTSPKVKIKGATHIEFDEHRAIEIAKQIVRLAIDNFPKRGKVNIPQVTQDLVPGFSHEYLVYMQGGYYRGSFRPLNDAVIDGRIRGVAGVVGCNNPRTPHDQAHNYIVRELIKNDVLVAQTGCGALASAKYGLMVGQAMEDAGPGLREVCEAIGIPPVLHLGSCVDNSRILTVLSQMATEGGLGEDIADLPAVGIAPEWMSEKALAIGAYFVASGAYVIFGVGSPVGGSPEVTDLINRGWQELVGGRLEFEPDPAKIVEKSLHHIDEKRAALNLATYDPTRFGRSGDRRLLELLAMPEEQRLSSLRGLAGAEKAVAV